MKDKKVIEKVVKKTPPPTDLAARTDKIFRNVFKRLIVTLMKRHQLPEADANYILEPLEETVGSAQRGLTYYDENEKPIT